MWSLFFRNNAKTKKCVTTAQACADCMWAHPMERPGRPQNQRKNMTYFRTYFFNQKMQKYDKTGSQKVSKRVTGFPGWRPWGRLGRPLTPQSVFEHKKYAQSAPKMTSRVQKWPQNASKVTPKVAKCTLTGAPKCTPNNHCFVTQRLFMTTKTPCKSQDEWCQYTHQDTSARASL